MYQFYWHIFFINNIYAFGRNAIDSIAFFSQCIFYFKYNIILNWFYFFCLGDYEYLHFDLKIDALSLVGRSTTLSQLYAVLVESVCRNLRLIGKSFEDQLKNEGLELKLPVPIHFKPPGFGHLITIVYLARSSTEENCKGNIFKLFLYETWNCTI